MLMAAEDSDPATSIRQLHARQVSRIREIPAAHWDGLCRTPDPFIRHAFLDALEQHGCVGGDSGWEPCHLVLEDVAGQLAAALPLYRKQHSWGEFVFDFNWARAAADAGLPYYPKLLCAIPFTPATGPRLLARDDAGRSALLDALEALLPETGCSSAHALFLESGDAAAASGHGFHQRHDLQFHWFNRDEADFAEFVSRLRHDKRKKVLRERRRVSEAGIRFETRRGDELDESEWLTVHDFYRNTYLERGQLPYLTQAFFLDYGRRPDTPVRLVLAREHGRLVAAAIFLVGGDVLYGRHWGCAASYHSLHFETCYYQGIELCLRDRLRRFDAGTQGLHKQARGFEPVVTRSVHRLADPRMHGAIGAWLQRERIWVGRQHERLAAHSPFRRT
jgi:uncharacterized protein